MKISKETINFNKEILFGEAGALIGTQAGGDISSIFTKNVDIISYSVVFGALVMASVFWLLMRAYDKSRHDKYSLDKFKNDLKYFTPASAFLTFTIYYPVLFFVTRRFLLHNRIVEFSSVLAQSIAFSLFLIGINIYRYILNKYYQKKL